MSRYIALTIGPIYGTIRKARRTRELWAASYLFSHLMKELCVALKDKGTILLPKDPEPPLTGKPGVGLYPDMLILEVKNGEGLTTVMAVANDVKCRLAASIARDIRTETCSDRGTTLGMVKRIDERVLRSYFHKYLRVFGVEGELEELRAIAHTDTTKPLPLNTEAITTGCTRLLSQLELRPQMAHHDPDPVRAFLSLANQSFLKNEAISEGVIRFPSLYEIATQELRFLNEESVERYKQATDREFDALQGKLRNDEGDDDPPGGGSADMDTMLREFRFGEHLHEYHRYATYVQADGDGIGQVIRSMRTTDELEQLCRNLASFAVAANAKMAGQRFTHGHRTEHGWGAVPVYIGGDDLLMLAPVVSKKLNTGPETIFTLVEEADKLFKLEIADKLPNDKVDKKPKKPTLSFGIGINYVKHPMREANEEAHELLAAVKKPRYKLRDRLHLRITKHSGGSFSAVYYKGGLEYDYPIWDEKERKHDKLSVWDMTLKLVKDYAIPIDRKDPKAKDRSFLNSLIAKVREQRAVLMAIGGDKARIEAWFANNFDEPHHHGFHESLFAELAAYVHAGHEQAKYIATKEPVSTETAFDEFIDCLYMTLRFIQFIRGHDAA